MQISINLNDEVRFELTEHGAEIYQDHRRNRGLEPASEPRTSMPLWRFMQIFGPRIRGNGGQPLTVGNQISAGEVWAVMVKPEHAVDVFDQAIQDRHRYNAAVDGNPMEYLASCGRELARLREDKSEFCRKRDLLADAIADALGEDWRSRSPVEAVRELARRYDNGRATETIDVTREPCDQAEAVVYLCDHSIPYERRTVENAVMALRVNRETGDVEVVKSRNGVNPGATLLGLKREIDDLREDLDEKRHLLDRAIAERDEWRREYRQLLHGAVPPSPDSHEGSSAGEPYRSAIGLIFQRAGERAYEVLAEMAGTDKRAVRGAVNIADYMASLIADDVKARPDSLPSTSPIRASERGARPKLNAETATRPTPSEVALSEFFASHTPGALARDVKPESSLDKPVALAGVRSLLPFNGPVHAVLHVVTERIADLDHEGANRWLDLFERMQSLDLDLDAEDTEA